MESKFHIKCRTGPLGGVGPLVLRIERDIRIISATIAPQRGSPKGLSIDHLVIFDMQSDGGVDGIEIFCPFGMDLTSRRAFPRPQETYRRLFLDPSGKEIMEPDVKVVMHRLDRFFTVRFKAGDVDSKFLLGPGITALVGANELLGLRIEMIKFIWPEPEFLKP
jgi:hypothetical protein